MIRHSSRARRKFHVTRLQDRWKETRAAPRTRRESIFNRLEVRRGAARGRVGRAAGQARRGCFRSRSAYARTREAEDGRAVLVRQRQEWRGRGRGNRHRRRRSRSAGVVGRDALSSPALAQLLRRRRRECVAARCRSPRSRGATGVTRVLVILAVVVAFDSPPSTSSRPSAMETRNSRAAR